MTKNNAVTFEPSSGNVFADLGLEGADELYAKALLAQVIRERIREKKLTQQEAAALIGTDQSKISQIINGRVSQFTYDRLLRFLGNLDCDIEIIVRPKAQDTHQISVAVHAA